MFPVNSGFLFAATSVAVDELSYKPNETSAAPISDDAGAASSHIGFPATNYFESVITYFTTHGMASPDDKIAVLAFLCQASKAATTHQVELFLSARHNGGTILSHILNAFELNAQLALLDESTGAAAGSKRLRDREDDIDNQTIWVSGEKWIDNLLSRSDLSFNTILKVIYHLFLFIKGRKGQPSVIINERAVMHKLSNFMSDIMGYYCPEISLSEIFGENLQISLSSRRKKICFEFASYFTDTDLLMMLRMVSSPIKYYNALDIIKRLIEEHEIGDEPCSWSELSNDYLVYPALYEPFFEAILSIQNVNASYILYGLFQLGILFPLHSRVSGQVLNEADILYHFISNGETEKIFIMIKQVLMISGIDEDFVIRNHLIRLLNSTVFYNFTTKQVSLSEREGLRLTIIDYLQLKEGTRLYSLLVDFGFNLLIDPVGEHQEEESLTSHQHAVMGSSTTVVSLGETESLKTPFNHLSPLFLMYLERSEKVDLDIFAKLIITGKVKEVFKLFSIDILNEFSGDPSVNRRAFETINKLQKDLFDFLVSHYFDQFVELSCEIIDDSTVNSSSKAQVVSLFMVLDSKKSHHAAYLSKIKEHFNKSWIDALGKHPAFTSMEALVVKEFRFLSYFLIDNQNFVNFADVKERNKIAFYVFFKERFSELSFASCCFFISKLCSLIDLEFDELVEIYPSTVASLSIYFNSELIDLAQEAFQDLLCVKGLFRRKLIERLSSFDPHGPIDSHMRFIVRNFPRFFSDCFYQYLLKIKTPQLFTTSKVFAIPKSLHYNISDDEKRAFKEKGDLEQKLNPLLTQLEIDLAKNLPRISSGNQDLFRELIYLIIHLQESSIGNRLKQHVYSHFAVKLTDPNIEVKLYRMLEENFSLQDSPIPVDITPFRKQFIDKIRKIIGSEDPLKLSGFLDCTQAIEYLEDEQPLIQDRLQVYQRQIKDDEDHLVPYAHVQVAMKTLIDTVLCRRRGLAVPHDSKDKRNYYDLLELKLKKVLESIQAKMRDKNGLHSVATVLTRIALSRDHCATRWMDEATAATSELDSSQLDSNHAEIKIIEQLYAERMSLMQKLTLKAFPEAEEVGPIHYFSAVQTLISHHLGLENPHEGYLSAGQFEEVQNRLIAFQFVKKFMRGYLSSIINILSTQSVDRDQKRELDETVLNFISKGYSLKFLPVRFISPIAVRSKSIFSDSLALFAQFKASSDSSLILGDEFERIERFLVKMEDPELKSELIFKDILPIDYFKKIIPFLVAHPFIEGLRDELFRPNLVDPTETERKIKTFFTSCGRDLDQLDLKFIGLILENLEVRMGILGSIPEDQLLRVLVKSRLQNTLAVYFNYYSRKILALPSIKLIQSRSDNHTLAFEYDSIPAISDALISALIDPTKNEALKQVMQEYLKKKSFKVKIQDLLKTAGFSDVTGDAIFVLISRVLTLPFDEFTNTLEDFLKRIITEQNRRVLLEGHLDKAFEQYPDLYQFFRSLYFCSLGFFLEKPAEEDPILKLLKQYDGLIDVEPAN
jgi:hypothetical protein